MQTIAIFSDIHGNATAFKAMLADAKAQGATDYWFLGDLLMPGPGVAEIWDLLEAIHPSQLVRGNWDDLVIHGARGEIDLKSLPTFTLPAWPSLSPNGCPNQPWQRWQSGLTANRNRRQAEFQFVA